MLWEKIKTKQKKVRENIFFFSFWGNFFVRHINTTVTMIMRRWKIGNFPYGGNSPKMLPHVSSPGQHLRAVHLTRKDKLSFFLLFFALNWSSVIRACSLGYTLHAPSMAHFDFMITSVVKYQAEHNIPPLDWQIMSEVWALVILYCHSDVHTRKYM